MKHLVTYAMFALIGCGGNDVSVSGDDPIADGEDVTNALCEWESDCGEWDYECTTTNSVTDCVATKTAVSYEACRAEELPDAIEAFQCAGALTSSERDLVNRCINKLTDTSCISQAEMDEYLAKIERGEEPSSLRPDPAECEALEPIFERCEPQRIGSTRASVLKLGRTRGQ